MSESDGNGHQGDKPVAQQDLLGLNRPEEQTQIVKSKKDSGDRRIGERLPFPLHAFEEALKVPNAIKNYNAGKPWGSKDIAKALEMPYGGIEFYRLTASSRDYGLTKGTTHTATIEIQDLGRNIVYAKSQEDEFIAIREAILSVPLFRSVYDYYQSEGGQLPELKYLQNTLETQFHLDKKYHQQFYEIYVTNLEYQNSREAKPDVKKGSAKSKPTATPAIVKAEPANKTGFTAFVAMPFTEKTTGYQAGFFKEVLKNLITPAATDAGFTVETALLHGSDVIHHTIVNRLLDADLVIVDLTEHNPNVLFELGLRMMSEDKPIALIRAKGTTAIFDVDNVLRVYEYDPKLWKSTIEDDLPKLAEHIKGSWEGRTSGRSYMKILRGQSEG